MNHVSMPVLLLTGFLGSGKTTLLNRILSNSAGIRFAVIVNDIGEVNIDELLIRKGGIVGQDAAKGDLVALDNGCICCSLSSDLMDQLQKLALSGDFDYIVIEASGVGEPQPIARTLEVMAAPENGALAHLDCIATVVDAARMRDEYACGEDIARTNAKNDVKDLIIDQIEFCNVVILNKISEVSASERGRILSLIRTLQPQAEILECDYCDVPLNDLLNTGLFDFERVATSPAWVRELEHIEDEEYEEHEHHHDHDHEHHHGEHCHCEECDGEHHHHHHHHHEQDERYGISSFVYQRRQPFNFEKFDHFLATAWPRSVIRCKGVLYFSHNRDMSLLFEQAGRQMKVSEAGLWYATAPQEELKQLMAIEPGLAKDWDPEYGDRMDKLVFIGRDMDKAAITAALDKCLE